MSRYVLLTEFFPPKFGGIEDTLGHHADWLGADVTVVTPVVQASGSQRRYQVVQRSLFSGQLRPRWLWLIPWLKQQLPGLQLVIFGHYSSAVFAAWFLKPWGLQYGLIVHGDDVLRQLQRPVVRWFVASHLRQAEWVSVNSDFMADQVQALGVPRVNIFSSHPVVAVPSDTPSQKTSTHSRLVTACRLVSRKNVASVVRLLPSLLVTRPHLHYDIIGDGPEKENLQRLVHELGLSAQVSFHGSVSQAEKWKLLSQADVAIMLPEAISGSHEVEGLGLFYLEASAAGLPVIGSRNGGAANAIQDGKTGVLVDSADTQNILRVTNSLLNNVSERKRLGQAGRVFVMTEFAEEIRRRRFLAMVQGPSIEKPPLVSFIIPAYQSADTIGATLEAILAQSWPHREVIVVNDGSTDTLDHVLRPFARQIHIINQENQGAPSARNAGAKRAKGEFLLFVDADVTLHPRAVTQMVQTLLCHPEAAYVYSAHKFGWKTFALWEYSSTRLKQYNYIHTTSLLRRALFPGFDQNLKRLQDWDLWLTLDASGQTGLWIPDILFTIKPKRQGISAWVPRIVYRLPFIGQGIGSKNMQRYRQAEAIIKAKHHLV